MSWFSNFFSKAKNNGASSHDQVSDSLTDDNVNVLEDLFVNTTPPDQVDDSNIGDNASLKSYFEQDFFRKGYEDGYNGHSSELLLNKIKSIKADFRYNLNLKIDSARQEMLILENHKIDVEGMSERLTRQLDNRLNAIRNTINDLEAEIALSALEEGLVMIAIHQYRDGFIRGTEAYQEEKLIAGSTGLFN